MGSDAGMEVKEVLDAVRSLLLEEVERVDAPVTGPDAHPSGRAGWHPLVPSPIAAPGTGQPVFDAETWRWFELVDLAYLDEMVVVEFRWTDPATPRLRYLLHCSVDQLSTAQDVALIVRTTLRRQLRPGWRERLGHHRLGHDRVLLLPGQSPENQLDDSVRW